jgi:IS5 family transposase
VRPEAGDSTLLEECLEQHAEQFGRAPQRVAADPGFFSAANESKAEQMGVGWVSIPSHDTKSPARKKRQKQRWFKGLQNWRTGCEGGIGVLKRRHGLRRSLQKGESLLDRYAAPPRPHPPCNRFFESRSILPLKQPSKVAQRG